MNLLILGLIYVIYIEYTLCFADDVIESLPGLTAKPSFRQYSGYLNGGQDIRLHYWFVESQSNSTKDPVILWLNGGPGCSSLAGLLTENGPFRVSPDGTNVTIDPNSWNTLANVLYLESPVGVGYSYWTKNGTFDNNDELTAHMNFLALKDFFAKYPQFSANEFYISGESYGGIYVPTLAQQIFANNSTINLKGISIGNGLFDQKTSTESTVKMLHMLGFIDEQRWSQLQHQCCQCNADGLQECDFTPEEKSSACNMGEIVYHLLEDIYKINDYNIFSDCPSNQFYNQPLKGRFSLEGKHSVGIYQKKEKCFEKEDKLWLSSPEVRKALHIADHLTEWQHCTHLSYKRQYTSMTPVFRELIDSDKLDKVIVYNGDIDMVENHLGSHWFVDSLGYKLTDKYKPWKVGGRVAGFVKRFDGITFMTVREAGHKAPMDQPEAVLQIVKELIGIRNVA